MKNNIWRAVVEVGFIIFLFYSNLLMGEMERTASGRDKGLSWGAALNPAFFFERGRKLGSIGISSLLRLFS
jgi:hypothetical protein